MLITIHGVKHYVQGYSRRLVALCSLLYMELSFMLIPIHGVKLCAHCYTCSEALSSLLYMV